MHNIIKKEYNYIWHVDLEKIITKFAGIKEYDIAYNYNKSNGSAIIFDSIFNWEGSDISSDEFIELTLDEMLSYLIFKDVIPSGGYLIDTWW